MSLEKSFMQKEARFFNSNYTFEKDFARLEISGFATLSECEFKFKDSSVFKGESQIPNDEFIKALKLHIQGFKEIIQKYMTYLNESEKIFENFSKSMEFIKKYSHKKYNLKKLYSNILSFYSALEMVANEQIWLKNR